MVLASNYNTSYRTRFLNVEWHRVIVDESHQKLPCDVFAKLRWCVTGTPFSTSMKDVNAQFRYLNLDRKLSIPKSSSSSSLRQLPKVGGLWYDRDTSDKNLSPSPPGPNAILSSAY